MKSVLHRNEVFMVVLLWGFMIFLKDSTLWVLFKVFLINVWISNAANVVPVYFPLLFFFQKIHTFWLVFSSCDLFGVLQREAKGHAEDRPALIDVLPWQQEEWGGGNDLYGDGSCIEHAVPPSLAGLLTWWLLLFPCAVIITAFVFNYTSSVKSQQSPLCNHYNPCMTILRSVTLLLFWAYII